MLRDLAICPQPMRILSLCAGIGGLDLGIKFATSNAARTVCVVEREGYCASVLRARMEDGSLDDCPIWSDLKTFDPAPWRGRVDCIIGGYPCQPFSAAGKRKGADDPRHLWPYIAGHIRAIQPAFCFFENVPGHLSLGFEQVCEELCDMGYSVEAGIFSAAEVGAPHLRKRLFFLAHADGSSLLDATKPCRKSSGNCPDVAECDGNNRNVANAEHGNLPNGNAEPRRGQPLSGPARQCSDVANSASPRLAQRQSGEGGQGHGSGRVSQSLRRGSDVAHADSKRQLQQSGTVRTERGRIGISSDQMADTHEQRCSKGLSRTGVHQRRDGIDGCGVQVCASCAGPAKSRLVQSAHGFTDVVDHIARGWPSDWEDGTSRVATGVPHRVDRLRALGNAVVPQTAALAWVTLMSQAQLSQQLEGQNS